MIREINIENVKHLLDTFNQNVGNSINPFIKCIGFYKDNQIVGTLLYEEIYERIEIDYIIVKESFRRQNIASKLMEYVINLNSDNITLEVNTNNISAINLYKKYGFKIVSKRENYYKNEDAYLMIRR